MPHPWTCLTSRETSHVQNSTFELLLEVFDSLSSSSPPPLRQIIAHLPPPSPSLCCPHPAPPPHSFLDYLRKDNSLSVVAIAVDGTGQGALVVTWHVRDHAAAAGAAAAAAGSASACAVGQVLSSSDTRAFCFTGAVALLILMCFVWRVLIHQLCAFFRSTCAVYQAAGRATLLPTACHHQCSSISRS